MDTADIPTTTVSEWYPISNPLHLALLGKLGEEVGELISAAAECLRGGCTAQAVQQLEDEVADVIAMMDCLCARLDIEQWYLSHEVAGTAVSDNLNDIIVCASDVVSAIFRCVIQGIDGCEPKTGLPNRDWLIASMSRLSASMRHLISRVGLDQQRIMFRRVRKVEYKERWFASLAAKQTVDRQEEVAM